MTFSLGQSFFTPQTATIPRHLWIIISDPQPGSNRIAIVNLSTKRSNPDDPADPPCIVRPGEHPSVSLPSFVRCEQANLIEAEKLEEAFRKRQLSPTRPAPPELVKKIQLALAASKETRLEVKALLKQQGYV